MPHDRKGAKLHPGDIVMIPCVITGVDRHSEYINLALETVEGRHPDGKREHLFINARQVELLQPIGESNPEMDVDHVFASIRDSDSSESETEIVKRTNMPIPPRKKE